jgi:hypothetical protein
MSENLPDASHAWVEEKKILRYLLNLEHAEGGPKAKFFRARGFTEADWEGLAKALCHHAQHNAVSEKKVTEFATSYILDCHLPTPDRTNPCIRTVWEIRPEVRRPRLITAYPFR